MSNDEIDETSSKKRRDILTRRPSYRKILNDLGGGEIAGEYTLVTKSNKGLQQLQMQYH